MPVPIVLWRYFAGCGTFCAGVLAPYLQYFAWAGESTRLQEMTANYISRASVLLQYYTALGELAEESRLASSEGVRTLGPVEANEDQPAPYTIPQDSAASDAALL